MENLNHLLEREVSCMSTLKGSYVLYYLHFWKRIFSFVDEKSTDIHSVSYFIQNFILEIYHIPFFVREILSFVNFVFIQTTQSKKICLETCFIPFLKTSVCTKLLAYLYLIESISMTHQLFSLWETYRFLTSMSFISSNLSYHHGHALVPFFYFEEVRWEQETYETVTSRSFAKLKYCWWQHGNDGLAALFKHAVKFKICEGNKLWAHWQLKRFKRLRALKEVVVCLGWKYGRRSVNIR